MAHQSLRYVLREDRPPDVALRAWRRDISKVANTEVGEYWHKKYLKGHFKPGAAEKYGYRARSAAYLRRKKRQAEKGAITKVSGQIVDNVFTGKMRAAVLRGHTTRGYPTRVTITVTGPKYLTTRFYKVDQPNKPAEIMAITAEEERDLAEFLARRIGKHLDKYRKGKGKGKR